MKHSHAAVERLRGRLLDVLASDHPDGVEANWRLEIIIRWWLDQMKIATHGRTEILMDVLTQALNDSGITTYAVMTEIGPTVQ